MLALAEKYAKYNKTIVIEGAYRIHEDGSITFVLASGPKLTMTEVELRKAIAKFERVQKSEEVPPEPAPKSKPKGKSPAPHKIKISKE